MNSEGGADGVVKRCLQLHLEVDRLLLQPSGGDAERKALWDLSERSAELVSDARKYRGEEVALANLEHDSLRPLAINIRRFVLRHHLTCAWPRWGSVPTPRPNSLAVFGEPDLEDAIARVADPLRLNLAEPPSAETPERMRWHAICGSNLAVFDFRIVSLDQGAWADVSHALGIALSVGRLPVIITNDNVPLPFDVHVDARIISDESSLDEQLESILATAAATPVPPSGRGSSVQATIDYALERLDIDTARKRYFQSHIQDLTDAGPLDAISAGLYLKSMLWEDTTRNPVLLTPVWAGSYPDANRNQCFHILPFALDEAVSHAVESACDSFAVYKRGDTTGSIDVIDGIWDGIGTATHVVADLTPAPMGHLDLGNSPNPNVCLEVAMAQVLGRELLLVRDSRKAEPKLFPEISKLQVNSYGSPETLSTLIRQFLEKPSKH